MKIYKILHLYYIFNVYILKYIFFFLDSDNNYMECQFDLTTFANEKVHKKKVKNRFIEFFLFIKTFTPI